MRSHVIGMNNSNRHIMEPVRRSPVGPSILFGEWQQRGPETLSGHVFRKLRLTLAPPQSVAVVNARGWENQP